MGVGYAVGCEHFSAAATWRSRDGCAGAACPVHHSQEPFERKRPTTIEILGGFPSSVVAFGAKGRVSKEDYDDA